MTPSLVIKPERSCGYILCCSSGNVILSEEHNNSQSHSTNCFESFMNVLCCRSTRPLEDQDSRIRNIYKRQLEQDFGPVVSKIVLSQINWSDPKATLPDHIQREAEEVRDMLPIFEKAFKHYRVYKLINEGPHPCSPLARKNSDLDQATIPPLPPVFILKNNKKELFEKEKIIQNLQTIALQGSLERLGEIAEDIENYVRNSKKLITSDEILRLVVKEILSKNLSINKPQVELPYEFSAYSKVDEIPPDLLASLFNNKSFAKLKSNPTK